LSEIWTLTTRIELGAFGLLLKNPTFPTGFFFIILVLLAITFHILTDIVVLACGIALAAAASAFFLKSEIFRFCVSHDLCSTDTPIIEPCLYSKLV